MNASLFTYKRVATALAAVIFFGLVFYFLFARPVSQVGDWKIYKKDISYRDQVIKLSFPDEKRSLGQLQIEKSATSLQILKNNGMNISDEQIEAEEKRIDQNTKDPEQLNKIKKIFGNDKESYRRDFILPALVDRMIYSDFFLNNDKIHAESLKLASDFIAATKDNPASFHKIADEKKYKVVNLTVSMKDGLTWDDPSAPKRENDPATTNSKIPMKIKMADNKNQALLDKVNADLNKPTESGNNEEAEQWYENVISFLKEGQVSLIPINRGESWMVAHYLKQQSKGVHKLEVVSFQKLDYGTWLEAEKAKVQVKH